MAQQMNQFVQAPVLGQMDMMLNTNTISAMIDPSYAGAPIVAGTLCKRVSHVGAIPLITPITANTDKVFCAIQYDIKQQSLVANDRCNVSYFRGDVMYLNSSAAIAAYAPVAGVFGTPGSVKAPATGEIIIGQTYDAASASGQLIRVTLDLPGQASA